MDWTRGHTLGRGSTAAVYIAKARQSGQVFAVKSAELHRSELLKREQGILSTLKCPQIVAYQGCDVTFENGAHWYNLFMEYAPHGTLAEAVHGGGMEEDVVGSYTRQVLLGLNYLHSNGIVHCDVKGQNVLVTDQGAKIADLGCARRVDESSSVIAGTPVFMAPEVARGEQQGFPADVWALGCTVLEMITGKPPWQGISDPSAVLYRIGFSGEMPEIPSFVSEQGKDFLSKCLKSDPNERWSVVELLGHGFVGEYKELALSDSDTPTSVLEQGFWDSVETTQYPTRDNCSWDSPSPRDRIRRLFSAEPIWEWGDDDDDDQWVTVRSNELEGLSIEQTQDPGSDTIYILRDLENGLVTFYEPKFVVTTLLIELSRWNAIIDDCYLSGSNYGYNPCPKIVPQWKFDSYNREIFIMHRFLLFLPSLISLWMNRRLYNLKL